MVGEEERFAKQCKDAYQYMASLMHRAKKGEQLRCDELLSQLNSVVEELCVAREKLTQQSEELTATRDQLAAQRQHYQELFELAPDGYLVTNKDGTIAECNLAGATMLQMSRKHLLGKPISLFISSADQKSFSKRLSGLLARSGSPGDSWQLAIQPRTGISFQALITAKVFRDSEGRIEQLRWLIHDISERQELEQQRQWLLGRLVNAHEEERSRIARELHDKMAQHLTALIIRLQSLKKAGFTNPAISEDIDRLQRIAEDIGREAHVIATELRPAALDDLGLMPALSNYVREWSEQTGIPVNMHCSGFGAGQPCVMPEIRTAVYRIVQQSLTNVIKHAQATQVSVVLERRSDHLLAIVEDNGVGFDVETVWCHGATKRSLGLIGMRERATLLGGTLDIESKPGSGTTVFVRIPLSSPEDKEPES